MPSRLSRRALLAALAALAGLLGAALALAGVTALILPTHTPGVRYSKVDAGDDLADDLRQGLDEDDPPAVQLHEGVEGSPTVWLALLRPKPGPLRGRPLSPRQHRVAGWPLSIPRRA